MGRLFITLLAPLTYLHFGGATLLVVNQPPRATISRSVSTQRLGQPYVNQPFRNTNNVFGINSQTQQWPRSARRRGDVTFKRERPTHAWIPEPSGMLTQWPQGQRTQSEWIPIESIPKSNNPSEWIQRRNVPPPKLFKPEVTSTRKVSNRRRPIESKPSKTKRRRKSSTKKKWKRTLSDEETLNLMEKYVNKKLALEERRIMENEQTKNAKSTLPPTVTEPGQPAALPPALDFLSGRQFGVSSGTKTHRTIIQNPFEDLRNQSDVQQMHNPTDNPSLVPIPQNTESIDFYSNAFKALTDAFRLAEASDINSSPQGVNEQHTFEELPTTNTTESKPLDLDSVSNTDSLINDILASALPQESFDILGLDSSIGQYITQDNTTKSEVQPVTRPEVQPVTRPEVQPVTQPEEQPISRPEVQPVARAEVQPVTRPEVQPFAQPEVKPVTRPEVQPVTRPEVQPVTQPEEQPISRPEVQPVARAEVQPVTRLEVQPFAQPEVQPVVRPEVQPVTRPEDLTRVDNQSISQIPTYSFEGETTETSNHTVETESVTKAIEVDISARRTRDKPMAHSLDNIKEITKTDKTGQMPSPALAQDLPFESATERLPERERRPLYDIFGGGRQQLDLFSSDPPVDRNHPFSNRFKSNRFQQFEVSDNQINTNNDMFHRESSPHHSSNRPTTKTSEHPQYDQRHIQTFDQPAYRERHTDARDHQPYEIPPQHHDNSLDSFSRRRPKPRHQELHHIEISIPTNNGWETHSSSIYGIDPSETRHAHYDPPPVENQGFERRRKPTGYFRQSSEQASSYHTPQTLTQNSWSDPSGTQDRPYVNEFDKHNPDPYAPDYMRRTSPSLSHFENQEVVRTGQQHDLMSNQVSRYREEEGTVPVSTTEDPPTEHVGEFRSNGPNQIDTSSSWPQSQPHSPSQGAWRSYPENPQSTSWAGTETNNNGWERRVNDRTNSWERRVNDRTNSWQQSVPTHTAIWARHSTGYDAQGGRNTQNGMYEYNEQNGYGQENTQYDNNEANGYSQNGYNDYTGHEGYNNEAQTIDYTDGEGNGGNDDSDEDDR